MRPGAFVWSALFKRQFVSLCVCERESQTSAHHGIEKVFNRFRMKTFVETNLCEGYPIFRFSTGKVHYVIYGAGGVDNGGR